MKVTGQQPPKPGDITDVASGKSKEAERKGAQARALAKEGPAPVGNRTSLTTNKVKEVIQSTPDIRADRVAEVRARLMAGTYQVDADKLADRMISEAIEEDLDRS